MSQQKPRFHGASPDISWWKYHAAIHPPCGLQRGWKKREHAVKHFKDTGMSIAVEECDCEDTCRCEWEA